MSSLRTPGNNRHLGAFLISSLLWAFAAFSAATAVITASDVVAQEIIWQTTTLRGENAAAQAAAAAEAWFRKEAAAGRMLTAEGFSESAAASAKAATAVPDSVLDEIRAAAPYAEIRAEVIDLNYADSYGVEAQKNKAPRCRPLNICLKNEAGENTDYKAKYMQLNATVSIPSEHNAVFSRSETFLALLAKDGSLRLIRLYAKKS